MVTAEALCAVPPRRAVRMVQEVLAAAGCPDADFDARELYRLATGRDGRLDDRLSPEEGRRLADLTARRAAREPLQYLAGCWDFLDFTLRVGPGVLCPRADSEVVCETAIELLQGNPAPQVLDLCAGTGCLGLGIKRFVPEARVRCLEKSDAAWPYLTENAAHALSGKTVEPVRGDVKTFWQQLPPSSLDLIISNPPYLTGEEMAHRMPETAREPEMALDGGADGLEFYRCILRHYRQALVPGGALVLEIGCAQAQAVLELAAGWGWQDTACRRDYGGNDRVIVAHRGKEK